MQSVHRPRARGDLGAWQSGDTWLAGGTGLFAEPQPDLRRLIDLPSLGWPSLLADEAGVEIAATCTVAELFRSESSWPAWALVKQCCEALVGSFKIWNVATVGGNLCLALPAGPMTALTAALEGVCTIWTPDGGERQLSVLDFVTGASQTALAPGELLRSIWLPAHALADRPAFRQLSLSPQGRSAALLIGRLAAAGRFTLTITASTRRPVQLVFPVVPSPAELAEAISALPAELYFEDVHGSLAWRRHLTALLGAQIRDELAAA